MGIRAQNVVKRFGDFVALDDVSVDIPTGSLTALLGPSGGGKSTLLRIIAGPRAAGLGVDRDRRRGLDRASTAATQRRLRVPALCAFKHMTVRGNRRVRARDSQATEEEVKDRVDELLALVHLSQFADRYPSQLSGGQRQRMALARALAVEPQVLLLDEPFGALDAKVRKELRDWLRRLHDEVHVTTVFVTHDQEEAMEVADEIVVINNGAIEQIGSPDQLYDQPVNDFVMNFLGPVTRLGDVAVRPHDIEIPTHDAPASVPARVTRLVRLGFEVRVDAVAAARTCGCRSRARGRPPRSGARQRGVPPTGHRPYRHRLGPLDSAAASAVARRLSYGERATRLRPQLR
jgi:sulfate transport system ATP-binding protein